MAVINKKPKEGDIETRAVVAINSSSVVVRDMLARLAAFPKRERMESRIYMNGKWTDWKNERDL